MADAPSDEEILAAVAEHLGRPGPAERLRLAGTARISRQPVLECTITRSVETRAERERSEPAPFDLSRKPVYEDLDAYDATGPKDPRKHQTLELVQTGTVREVSCVKCTGGRQQCLKCGGRGLTRCEPDVPCPNCRNVTSCTKCRGKGGSRRTPVKPVPPRKVKRPGERVDCVVCETPGTACPGCEGRGHTLCPKCDGRGECTCDRCGGKGHSTCGTCAGRGLLVKWRGGTITHTPHAERVPGPEPSPPLLLRRRLHGGAWRTHVLSLDQSPPEDLPASHRSVIEARLVRREGEVARRVSIKWLPLARVEIEEEVNRVFYVFPEGSGLSVVPVPSRHRMKRAAAVAAACLAALVLVLIVAAR
ncbi:hypothetical protein ACWGJT_01965 [Streptomyces xantholiticus]